MSPRTHGHRIEHRDGRPAAALALAVGATVALLFGAFFFSYERPWALRGDNELTFLPLCAEVWRQWSAGLLPQWSNGHHGGVPLLTDSQAGVFYLPNLVAFGLTAHPHLRAFDLLTALHLGIFAAGTVWLLRALGASRPAALLGAAIATLAPHVLWWTSYLPASEALAWWPWLLLAAERFTKTDRSPLRDALFGSAVLSASIYAGYVEFAFYGACVAAVWISCARSALALPARLGRVAALAGLTVLLAAPQLIPTVLEIPDTYRASAPNHMGSLGVDLTRPHLLVSLVPASPIWSSPFLGATTLLLAASAIWRRQPRAWLLAAILIVTALLAMGDRLPAYRALVALPGFHLFRGPAKFYLLTQLATALLAALGASSLLSEARWKRVGMALVALSAAEYAVYFVVRAPRLAAPHTAAEAKLPDSVGWLREAAARTSGSVPPPAPPPRTYWAGPLGSYGSLGMLFGMELLTGGQVSMINHRARYLRVGGRALGGRDHLDLFGVQFVAASGPCAPYRARGLEPLVERPDQLCLLRNPSAAPRYEMLTSFAAVGSEQEMLERVKQRPRAPVPIVLAAGESAPLPSDDAPNPGEVEVLEYRPGLVRLVASSPAASWLLARESWSRGWTATVDGGRARIHPAAGLFFAMRVPEGRHEVVLRYATPGLVPGLLGLAAWCVLAAWHAVASVRRPPQEARRDADHERVAVATDA